MDLMDLWTTVARREFSHSPTLAFRKLFWQDYRWQSPCFKPYSSTGERDSDAVRPTSITLRYKLLCFEVRHP